MAITYEFEEQSMDTVKSEIAAIYDRNEGRSIRSTISRPVDGWIKVLVVVQDMEGECEVCGEGISSLGMIKASAGSLAGVNQQRRSK